jgi:hypothetical protein
MFPSCCRGETAWDAVGEFEFTSVREKSGTTPATGEGLVGLSLHPARIASRSAAERAPIPIFDRLTRDLAVPTLPARAHHSATDPPIT